jgi:hypothetical protein
MLSLLTTLIIIKMEGIVLTRYMNKVKSVIDDLALIIHLLSDVEIIARTLNGLVDKFKELTVTIHVNNSLLHLWISMTNFLIKS